MKIASSRIKLALLGMAGLILLIYFAIAPVNHPEFVNQIAFYPGPEPPDTEEYLKKIGVERLSIPVKSGKVEALFLRRPGAQIVCLYSHGNADSMVYRWEKAMALYQAGVSVMLYDYEGYGKSSGKPSLKVVADDGLAAYNYLVDQLHYKPHQILLYGESIGGGISAEIARHGDSAGLILDSTFLSPAAWASERFPVLYVFPEPLLLSPSLNVERLFPDYKKAVLLFKPGSDNVIPTTHSDRLFARITGKKMLVTLKHSGHALVDSADMPVYKEAIKQFIDQLKP